MEKNRADSNKVFVVGLDGGTFDLVRPWVEQGCLPTFRRLMEEGMAGDLIVELPPGTVPNWPSFMTGKNAGKHGVIHWFTRIRDFSKWSVVNSQSVQAKTVWEIVASHGKRFVSINVPVTYPPKALDEGLMITGLLTPPTAKIFTYPPELQKEIESAVGRYKVYADEIYREGKEEKFLASLMETLDIRFRTSRYLMDRYPWDLFMIVFSETDAVQHAFWKFIDPLHPKYDEKMARRFSKGILQIYQKIDSFLGEYLKTLTKGTTLIVMSDHGAGPFYKKFYTNNWLIGLGYLTVKKSFTSRSKYWFFRHGFTLQNIYRLLLKMRLENWRRVVDKKESGESLIRKLFLSYEDVDWETTSAFAFGGFGQIYLNVKDHEGDKRSSASAYKDLQNRIIQSLREVQTPDGGALVEQIHTKENLYSGPHVSVLPDIVFMQKRGYTDPGEYEFFSNKIFDEGVGASGSHRQNGLCLMWGEKVQSKAASQLPRIHDLVPTALYLLGLPVPSDMDGRVLLEALKDDWLDKHPVRYVSPEDRPGEEGSSYSQDEEEQIKKTLRGLGYLG